MGDDTDLAGTGAGLIEFLEWVASKGLMNQSTAKAYRAAAREVLGAVEEDWPSLDLREIDVEDVLQRFQVKAGMRYTPRSLTTYRSRFRNAVEMYSAYLLDPVGRRPPRTQSARAVSTTTATSRARRADPPESAPGETTIAASPVAPRTGPGMQTYPFPLRRASGVIFATLTLPADLTAQEAERLGAHHKTLAIPETLALPHPPKPEDT
jgi:hypothetical protein